VSQKTKDMISQLVEGIKDGEDFTFGFKGKPVSAQIVQWHDKEKGRVSTWNLTIDNSTMAVIYSGQKHMSLEMAALEIIRTIITDSDDEALMDEFFESLEQDDYLKSIMLRGWIDPEIFPVLLEEEE